MIYTVTLNPALDRAIVVDRLLDDDTTRVLYEKRYAAGKGIDVSRVIRELGGKSVALGLVGGYDGLELEGLLINAGVLAAFTKIGGETHINIILTEKATRPQHVISAAGPKITASEIGQLYNDLQKLQLSDTPSQSFQAEPFVSDPRWRDLRLAPRTRTSILD